VPSAIIDIYCILNDGVVRGNQVVSHHIGFFLLTNSVVVVFDEALDKRVGRVGVVEREISRAKDLSRVRECVSDLSFTRVTSSSSTHFNLQE
jgi:hypothetical protein